MTRMFEINGKKVDTYNAYTGCSYGCSYCYARDLIGGRLANTPKYIDCGFKPTLHSSELQKSLGKNRVWFVSSLGELWGNWVDDLKIELILSKCKGADKSNTFYFLTKNPIRYIDYFNKHADDYQDNFVLGATIESDSAYPLETHAPHPSYRIDAMARLTARKFISIEPVLNFTNKFIDAIIRIKPEFVYIGYDNHNFKLPEPKLEDTRKLISDLQNTGIEVREKTIRKEWYD